MLRRVLTYGTVAGAIVGVPLSGLTIAMNGHALTSYGTVIGYTLMLIALSTVFVAIKRHRDEDLGGVITFWPAFPAVPAAHDVRRDLPSRCARVARVRGPLVQQPLLARTADMSIARSST